MNNTLLPVRSLDRHEQHALSELFATHERIRLVDRLSLRVGLWLLLRSERAVRRRRSYEEHTSRYRSTEELQQRRHAAERAALLNAPRW